MGSVNHDTEPSQGRSDEGIDESMNQLRQVASEGSRVN